MTTLNIRDINEAAAERLKRGAAARGLRLGEYVALLARLHDTAIRYDMDELLTEAGLERAEV